MKQPNRASVAFLESFHYPRYAELPDELVFLDDIVALVNEVHKGLPPAAKNNKERFTSSMASNYIKQGLTPPAIGKKYSKEHICLILLASTLKLAYSAGDVVAITRAIFSGDDFASTQDMVACAFEKSAERMVRPTLSIPSHASKREVMVELLADAFAAKTSSLLMLAEFN